MIKEVTDRLIINYNARTWCKLPYPNHPKGCPNYGKNKTCPPKIGKINKLFDLSKQHWFVIAEFDLKFQAKRMKEKHPDWTERQCVCCLYWQGGVRKRLHTESKEFCFSKIGTVYNMCPEAMGIDVIKTMQQFKIPIQRNPKNMIYKVALVGYKKKGK